MYFKNNYRYRKVDRCTQTVKYIRMKSPFKRRDIDRVTVRGKLDLDMRTSKISKT